MGFSSALQGRAAHEALLLRQDAELRLLDTMKRCLSQKVKCDKEYAVALAAVSQQGLKIDRADDLYGSQITKAWRSVMEEWDQTAKQLKANAELLESVCQDKLTHLYQDKRKARKAYQEEHCKIATQFTNLTDEVARKKAEYQKHLDYYKLLRSRFEEHYIKSGRGGRKLDDVRDKYQKACRKLHLAHNEYVLLISEAIEVEKDFRTILLPGLLEHQQSIQEGFITVWRNILLDASQNGDFTADKFREIQRRIETNLQNVNPSEEYRDFTEKHKTSPTSPIVFQFDQTLLEDKDTLGKLQPNSLTVDNLTVDWLRSRLNDLENSIKECQEKQTKLITENGSVVPSSPISNGMNGIGKDHNKQSKDLNALRCHERQMIKLAEIIKTALNEVGCEELPSGCDDLSVDQSFIENNVTTDQPDLHNSSYFMQKGAEVISLIKAPFKRKSAPTITSTLTPKGTPKNNRAGSTTRSISLGSSVNSLDLAENSSNCNPIKNTNIYADIDVKRVRDNNRNTNIDKDTVDLDDTADSKDSIESSCLRLNGSKNNLLKSDEISNDLEENSMWSSVSVYLKRNDEDVDEEKAGHFRLSNRFDKNIIEDSFVRNNFRDKIRNRLSADGKLEISRETELLIDDNDIGSELLFNDKSDMAINHNSESVNNTEDNTKDSEESKLKQSVKKKFKELKNFKSKPDIEPSHEGNQNAFDFEEQKKFKLPKSNFKKKSVNTILNSFKDFKNSRKMHNDLNSSTNSQLSDNQKSIMTENHIQLNSEHDSEEPEVFEKISPTHCGHNLSCDDSPENNEDELNLLQRPIVDKSWKQKSFKKSTKSSRLKQNLKTKLKLPLRLPSKRNRICRHCLKPFKKIITSDKNTDLSTNEDVDNDYCVCISNHGDAHLMTLATNRPLYEEEWFHGVLPREEVVRLLKNEGDFLVRETIRNEESQIVLSVCWNGHKHFIVQTTAEGHFRFEGPAFPSIQELIMHQHLSEAPVTGRSGAVLKKPVMRERWELSNDDVILQDKIGRGNFGDVYKARLKSSKIQVAVKTCRMTLPDEQKRKFLQEGRILKQYDHPNIVKLIGICVQKQPIMIVMELVPGGSLLNFLRKNAATMNSKQLMCMCRDAAAGMRYLESKNCIHRDLAARNCLIGYENIVKISDFGMSREEEEYIVSDGMKQIPIKWTAPEALNFGKYTSLCDVWSYGILMWEIFSKGDTPYTGMSNSRARERIDSGYRMPAPDNTSPEMYRLMLKCWAYEPEARPHFDEIYSVVDALINRE